jgi:putative ABC transport system substrate-binding protein
MALTRRRFVLGSAILVAAGCVRQGPQAGGPASAYNELFRLERSGNKGRILVLMPATKQTREVWTGLSDELGREYALVAVRVDGREDAGTVTRAIVENTPRAIVLMNNPTVAAYAAYQAAQPRGTGFPPAVIVMTSFLDGQPFRIQRATGISYEVPLITVVTNLRKLLNTPIRRVGVVRRVRLREFVERQALLATHEGISVEQEVVSASPNAAELKRALRLVRQRSDALWVLNDDRLLTPQLIGDAWFPGVSERPFIPTIVGAAPLVSPVQSFGTFAMLPDHTALGVQAASLLFDLADADWILESTARAQLPLSTTTSIDLVQAREHFVLREGALTQVDRIVK